MTSSLGRLFIQLCGSAARSEPYLHLLEPEALSHHLRTKLREQIPREEEVYEAISYPGACPDHRCHGASRPGKSDMGKGLVRMLRHDVPLAELPYVSVFRDVLHSTVFKHVLWERLRLGELHSYLRSEQTYVATSLFQDSTGYDIAPHPDAGFKLASFFFPVPSAATQGLPGLGTQICTLKPHYPQMRAGSGWQPWENFNCVDSGFSPGHFFAFRVTSDRLPERNRSWHAVRVPPMPAGHRRLLFRGHVCNSFLQRASREGTAYAPLPWQREEARRQTARGATGSGVKQMRPRSTRTRLERSTRVGQDGPGGRGAKRSGRGRRARGGVSEREKREPQR